MSMSISHFQSISVTTQKNYIRFLVNVVTRLNKFTFIYSKPRQFNFWVSETWKVANWHCFQNNVKELFAFSGRLCVNSLAPHMFSRKCCFSTTQILLLSIAETLKLFGKWRFTFPRHGKVANKHRYRNGMLETFRNCSAF